MLVLTEAILLQSSEWGLDASLLLNFYPLLGIERDHLRGATGECWVCTVVGRPRDVSALVLNFQYCVIHPLFIEPGQTELAPLLQREW